MKIKKISIHFLFLMGLLLGSFVEFDVSAKTKLYYLEENFDYLERALWPYRENQRVEQEQNRFDSLRVGLGRGLQNLREVQALRSSINLYDPRLEEASRGMAIYRMLGLQDLSNEEAIERAREFSRQLQIANDRQERRRQEYALLLLEAINNEEFLGWLQTRSNRSGAMGSPPSGEAGQQVEHQQLNSSPVPAERPLEQLSIEQQVEHQQLSSLSGLVKQLLEQLSARRRQEVAAQQKLNVFSLDLGMNIDEKTLPQRPPTWASPLPLSKKEKQLRQQASKHVQWTPWSPVSKFFRSVKRVVAQKENGAQQSAVESVSHPRVMRTAEQRKRQLALVKQAGVDRARAKRRAEQNSKQKQVRRAFYVDDTLRALGGRVYGWLPQSWQTAVRPETVGAGVAALGTVMTAAGLYRLYRMYKARKERLAAPLLRVALQPAS